MCREVVKSRSKFTHFQPQLNLRRVCHEANVNYGRNLHYLVSKLLNIILHLATKKNPWCHVQLKSSNSLFCALSLLFVTLFFAKLCVVFPSVNSCSCESDEVRGGGEGGGKNLSNTFSYHTCPRLMQGGFTTSNIYCRKFSVFAFNSRQ